MRTATPRTTTEQHRRPTCYEVAIDGTVVAYVARRTRQALLDVAFNNAADLVALLGDGDDTETYSREHGLAFGPVRVYFTGRTERTAAALLAGI